MTLIIMGGTASESENPCRQIYHYAFILLPRADFLFSTLFSAALRQLAPKVRPKTALLEAQRLYFQRPSFSHSLKG